ncbi:MAG: sugar transferase [Pyrinomonadaceae bacterium]|nr:sugar transferase [Pyrinomonadaceae bacterium]
MCKTIESVNEGESTVIEMVNEGLPRAVEVILAVLGLAVTAPLWIVAAISVAASSPGPILFRQERLGRNGIPFTLYKFRTMRAAQGGLQVTARDDARVTPVGRVLRLMKLDEWPELWNVALGDMSLVGPRPEVPRYVELDDPLWQQIFHVRPGLTDPVAVHLRNEEELMSRVEGDRERFYVQTLLRYKLLGNLAYLKKRTWRSDIAVLFKTIAVVTFPGSAPAPSLQEITDFMAEKQGAEAGSSA